jgi:hypothetical protein
MKIPTWDIANKTKTLWDATKESGFKHVSTWVKQTKLAPEAVYALPAREHYRVPQFRQQPTPTTITFAQTGTRIHRTLTPTTANLEAGPRTFKSLACRINNNVNSIEV